MSPQYVGRQLSLKQDLVATQLPSAGTNNLIKMIELKTERNPSHLADSMIQQQLIWL